MRQYQQGDVIIVGCNIASVINIDTHRIQKKRPTGLIREGETTGHAHKVIGTEFEVLELGGRVLARVISGDCQIVHEEHKPIALPPGEYEFLPVHEYDHFAEESRRVRD